MTASAMFAITTTISIMVQIMVTAITRDEIALSAMNIVSPKVTPVGKPVTPVIATALFPGIPPLAYRGIVPSVIMESLRAG